jgi:hypothetical protein
MKILVVTLVTRHAGEQDELTSISTVTSYLSKSNKQNTAVFKHKIIQELSVLLRLF